MALNVTANHSSMSASWCLTALRRPVLELERSADFYVRGLGFVLESRSNDHASLRLGRERLVLVVVDSLPAPADGPDPRFQHAAIVTSNMRRAVDRLMPLEPNAITHDGPQKLPAAAGGVVAFKFRDPDGHPLELIEFPVSPGSTRWQSLSDSAITLGIDHFALSVRDVPSSIRFYEQRFGFRVVSRQVNHGEAQARLDGLPVATVDVVALTPGRPDTPHIELLCYLSPVAQPVQNETFGAVDCLLLQSSAHSNTAFDRTTFDADPDGHTFESGPAPGSVKAQDNQVI